MYTLDLRMKEKINKQTYWENISIEKKRKMSLLKK